MVNLRRSVVVLIAMSVPGVSMADSPSRLLRQLPAIGSPPTAEGCVAISDMVERAQRHAEADMLAAQRQASSMMGAMPGAIDDTQSEVIEALSDPDIAMCEMNLTLSLPHDDLYAEFEEQAFAVQQATQESISATCPVIGKADHRESSCMDPIERKGRQQESQLLARYVETANARLATERDGYAACAQAREHLAARAKAARLPGPFVAIAISAQAAGWEQFERVAESHATYCEAFGRAADSLRARERHE